MQVVHMYFETLAIINSLTYYPDKDVLSVVYVVSIALLLLSSSPPPCCLNSRACALYSVSVRTVLSRSQQTAGLQAEVHHITQILA